MAYEIVMHQEAWDKFWTYVDLCEGEVAAFGYAEPVEDNRGGYLYVSEIFPVPQEVSSGGVDILEEGMPYAVEKAVNENKIDELRFCVHSHGSMSTFFSQTDEEMVRTIKKYAPDLPWFASAVFNRKHETYAQVDAWYGNTPLPDLPKHIVVKADIFAESRLDLIEEAKAELKEFVVEKKWTPMPNKKDKKKGDSKKQTTSTKGQKSSELKYEDTQLDKELREEAMLKGYDVYETSDGMFHFWDPFTNKEVGQAVGPTEHDSEWVEWLEQQPLIVGSSIEIETGESR